MIEHLAELLEDASAARRQWRLSEYAKAIIRARAFVAKSKG